MTVSTVSTRAATSGEASRTAEEALLRSLAEAEEWSSRSASRVRLFVPRRPLRSVSLVPDP